MQAWLRKQPSDVSVAFAARAALRVLPIVQTAQDQTFEGDFFADTVLPVSRATAVAWAAARYPTQGTQFRASAARAAAAVRADAAAFWAAISSDAKRVDKGATAFVIARRPLWPQGQPDQLRYLWQEMKAALQVAKQDWQVWTIWYDKRLAGRVRDEERELAYVRIEEAQWNQGPATVNAEIRRLIEEHEPPQHGVVHGQARVSSTTSMSAVLSPSVAEPAISAVPVDNPPIAGAAGQPRSEILSAWQSADAASQTPRYPPRLIHPSFNRHTASGTSVRPGLSAQPRGNWARTVRRPL